VSDSFLDIRRVMLSNGVGVEQGQDEKLRRYVTLLLEWNRRVNLISRRDEENIWENHILHSLAPLFVTEIPPGACVLDLGTGGGLPGVPLGILRSDLKITLLDSIRKKILALEDIIRALGADNLRTLLGRAEEIAGSDVAGTFDIVLARGVGPLVDLIRWSKPLVRRGPASVGPRATGGKKREVVPPALVAWKGGDVEAEVRLATTKTKVQRIDVVDLVFAGSSGLGLEGKKLIVVPL